jgi:hypothetical protein
MKNSLRRKPNGALKLMMADLPIMLMRYANAGRKDEVARAESLLRDVQQEVARRGLK